MQLSRAKQWNSICLFQRLVRGDFIELKDVLDKNMKEAIIPLEGVASKLDSALGETTGTRNNLRIRVLHTTLQMLADMSTLPHVKTTCSFSY